MYRKWCYQVKNVISEKLKISTFSKMKRNFFLWKDKLWDVHYYPWAQYLSIIFKKQVYFPKYRRSYKRCCASLIHKTLFIGRILNWKKSGFRWNCECCCEYFEHHIQPDSCIIYRDVIFHNILINFVNIVITLLTTRNEISKIYKDNFNLSLIRVLPCPFSFNLHHGLTILSNKKMLLVETRL